MKDKITFGKLTINLVTCPSKKSDFEKAYKNRVPDLDEAWKKVNAWKKKNKSKLNEGGE